MSYAEAKAKYATLGIDTDAAIAKLKNVPVALHCWQGDDVMVSTPIPPSPLPAASRPPAIIPAAPEAPRS